MQVTRPSFTQRRRMGKRQKKEWKDVFPPTGKTMAPSKEGRNMRPMARWRKERAKTTRSATTFPFERFTSTLLYVMPRRYKALLFDLDGTLVETRREEVGDSEADELAATRAGVDFVHVEAVKRYVQGYHL